MLLFLLLSPMADIANQSVYQVFFSAEFKYDLTILSSAAL